MSHHENKLPVLLDAQTTNMVRRRRQEQGLTVATEDLHEKSRNIGFNLLWKNRNSELRKHNNPPLVANSSYLIPTTEPDIWLQVTGVISNKSFDPTKDEKSYSSEFGRGYYKPDSGTIKIESVSSHNSEDPLGRVTLFELGWSTDTTGKVTHELSAMTDDETQPVDEIENAQKMNALLLKITNYFTDDRNCL